MTMNQAFDFNLTYITVQSLIRYKPYNTLHSYTKYLHTNHILSKVFLISILKILKINGCIYLVKLISCEKTKAGDARAPLRIHISNIVTSAKVLPDQKWERDNLFCMIFALEIIWHMIIWSGENFGTAKLPWKFF